MVCTGNICRSPLAEQLLRARLAEAGIDEIDVSSAGLHAVVDGPMDAIPAEISTRLGGDPSHARGRSLRSEIVDGADVLLTMTRDQRNELVQRYPRAMRRTFTITEYSKLLSLVQPVDGSLREQAEQLAQVRSRVVLNSGDDIADPYRASRAIHEAVGDQIALATSHLAHALHAAETARF